MLTRPIRITLARAMLLVVGSALVVMEVPTTVYDIAIQRGGIVDMAEQRADAALDMLEAVHVQSMLNRGQIDDGDAAIATLNGSMEQFSDVSQGLSLWIVMGPKVEAFQRSRGSEEIESPRDATDEAVIAEGIRQRSFDGDMLRISRPVVLGYDHAATISCAACHTGLMGVQPGEVLGAYSAAVDVAPALASWRAGALRQALVGLTILGLTLALIVALLRVTALRPMHQLAQVTRRLAAGETEIEVGHADRPDALGDMARSLAVFRDNLLERQRLEHEATAAHSEIQYLATHDGLTGLPNRALLAERLAAAIALTRRGSDGAAVLCLDLDHFKEVNDTLGHTAGDQLLRAVAGVLRSSIRETDTAARLGGDEFAIVLSGSSAPEEAEALCARLIELFAKPIRVMDQDVFVGVSIGVALVPGDGETVETLMKHADIALYRAKAEGRSTWRFFAAEMNASLQARKSMEQDLRAALVREEFRLAYQPAVDVQLGHIVGIEALLRWHHPEHGLVSPADFIPLAETTGLILPIGEWVLRKACEQAVLWPGLTMAVNVSPAQFRHLDFVGLVRRILEETGLPAFCLELEITEGVLLADTEAAVATLNALKALGVRIAMDDFGTGYSSLSYLRRFPFDKLKIDQSFVRSLDNDANAALILRSMVGLGRSLGMTTTAEGVETAAQLGFLRREGCEQVQGYHLGRPQPASGIDRLLADAADVGPPMRAAA